MANSIHKSLGKINYKIENMIIDYTNADLYTFSKNNGVTFVEEQRAFIVNGNNNKKKKIRCHFVSETNMPISCYWNLLSYSSCTFKDGGYDF